MAAAGLSVVVKGMITEWGDAFSEAHQRDLMLFLNLPFHSIHIPRNFFISAWSVSLNFDL